MHSSDTLGLDGDRVSASGAFPSVETQLIHPFLVSRSRLTRECVRAHGDHLMFPQKPPEVSALNMLIYPSLSPARSTTGTVLGLTDGKPGLSTRVVLV